MTDRDPEHSAEAELQHALLTLHLHEAVVIATNNGHAVLDVIVEAPDMESARQALQLQFGFSGAQAEAVMDLQFGRATVSGREKFGHNHELLAARVAALEEQVADQADRG